MTAAAQAIDAVKVYGSGPTRVVALDHVNVAFGKGRVHRHHGPVGLGQVDADALLGGAGHPDLGPNPDW